MTMSDRLQKTIRLSLNFPSCDPETEYVKDPFGAARGGSAAQGGAGMADT
jgi:hypothetical protein